MDWTVETAKDEALVRGLDLAPVGPDVTLGDREASALARTHNEKLARTLEEMDQLFSDCRRLVDPDTWTDRDAVDVGVARSRIRRARWDGLLHLSRLLRYRRFALQKIEKRLHARRNDYLTRAASAKATRRRRTRAKGKSVNADKRQLAAVEDALSTVACARCRALQDLGALDARRGEICATMVA